MNKNDYLESVAKLCCVEVNDIAGKSQSQLVNDYILPRGVEPTGQDTRGWRIGPLFMKFMTNWGQYCVKEDQFTGELLMEIAMQRLSKGAIIRNIDASYYKTSIEQFEELEDDDEATKERKRADRAQWIIRYTDETKDDLYAPYHFWFALPEGYREYSNWYDQPGLMDNECWQFFKQNILFCMTELQNQIWRWHAIKLCAGLLQHLSSDGEELDDYDGGVSNVPLKKIYQFSETVACHALTVQKVAEILLPTWRFHKIFFKKYEWEIDFPKLFKGNLEYEKEGERYFGKWHRRFLKLLGRYESSIEAKIKAEMMSAEEKTAVIITEVGIYKQGVLAKLLDLGYTASLAGSKLPMVVEKAVTKAEAEKLKEELEAVGATIELI